MHKEVGPFLTAAIERGEYRLLTAFEAAGRELAERHGFPPGAGLWKVPMSGFHATRGTGPGESWWAMTGAQEAARHLWFANLNTPEEFAEAEQWVDALDT